jgi:hypothetical protein
MANLVFENNAVLGLRFDKDQIGLEARVFGKPTPDQHRRLGMVKLALVDDHDCQPHREPETMRSKPYPLFDELIGVFGNGLKRRREIREMRELEPNEFTGIARELGITPEDLDTFVRKGPQAVDELPKLLKALGIDETALGRNQPLVLRDMERVCTACQQKHRCSRDLKTGTSAEHFEDYCLNALTIDALDRKQRD